MNLLVKFGLGISFINVFNYSYAEVDPCSTLADLKSKSDQTVFVGFGSASSQKEADQNAQIDLARNIRQRVTSTSTVSETNSDSSLKLDSKLVVSEGLINTKTLRRCKNSDSYSTVVTLEKEVFISSIEEKIKTNLKKADTYLNSIKKSKNDEHQAELIEAAKKFLNNYQSTSESDLELCKIYKGCVNIKNEHVLTELAELLVKMGDKDQYILITSDNEISKSFRNELISLFEDEGLKIMDSAVADNAETIKRKILVNCKSKVGTQIPGTGDHVVTVNCLAEAYIGKQKKFRRMYSCKSVSDSSISTDDAVNACSGRLTLD